MSFADVILISLIGRCTLVNRKIYRSRHEIAAHTNGGNLSFERRRWRGQRLLRLPLLLVALRRMLLPSLIE